jgi:hypothetical protein
VERLFVVKPFVSITGPPLLSGRMGSFGFFPNSGRWAGKTAQNARFSRVSLLQLNGLVVLDGAFARGFGSDKAETRAQLASFKMPREFVIVEKLPRTALGKI